MQGLHLTADLAGCPPDAAAMTQAPALRRLCRRAACQAGLTAVGELFHRFEPRQAGDPAGVTGVLLLTTSHLAVHTWPERGAVTLDLFVCAAGPERLDRIEAALAGLIGAFAPRQVQRQQVPRAALPEPTGWRREAAGVAG